MHAKRFIPIVSPTVSGGAVALVGMFSVVDCKLRVKEVVV